MTEETQEIRDVLNSSMLANAKLARAVEIMMSYHLTAKEKESIAKRIDICKNLEDLEITMKVIGNELQRGFIDESTGERWSPKFVEDIKQYYESGFPFNPIKKVGEIFSSIKEFIVLQEIVLKLEENDEKKDSLNKDLDEKRKSCVSDIKQLEELLNDLGA
jgi:Trp operon repressor